MEKANVYIRMMGKFVISVDGVNHEEMMRVSPKGLSLLEILILAGRPVHSDAIIEQLWAAEMAVQHVVNREKFLQRAKARLKTLVCRTRDYLNQLTPGLGECIVSIRGAYFWRNEPGVERDVETDVWEVISLCADILGSPSFDVEQWSLAERLIRLYDTGLYLSGDWAGGPKKSFELHERYLQAVFCYLTSLERRGQATRLYRVAGEELKKDPENPDLLRIRGVAAARLKEIGVPLPEETAVSAGPERKPPAKRRETLTDERADALRALPIVEKVTAKYVSFTEEFKEYFAREYEKGISAWDILRSRGVDPELLGWGRIAGLCVMAKQAIRRKQVDKAAPVRASLGKDSLRMSRRIAELEDEIAYLNRKLEVLERKREIAESGDSVPHSAGGR
ncbi:MAG: hypothetical protein J6M64_12260 [Oscillospiraceae bacterium]|nr:hypothetical protein [Oscillospiraceae bacterium]